MNIWKSHIHHFHLDHIMHLIYSSTFCIAIVSNFSWVLQSSQEKTMVIQTFGGLTRFIMVCVRTVN